MKIVNRQHYFPERLDDYISEDNSVRVIDVFIDSLKVKKLGFASIPKNKDRPGFDPALLPTFAKTTVVPSSKFAELVLLCKKLDLFSSAVIAVDGSKFKAVNNADRAFSKAKIKRRREKIDESIDRYLEEINKADRQDTKESRNTKVRLKARLAHVKEEAKRLELLEKKLLDTPDQQLSLTDPDARIIATRGRSSVMVGYNVQTAVDTKSHLIIAHEVTNVGHDRTQLTNMAKQAKAILERDELKVVADRGYYSGQEILDCENNNITTYLPKTQTSNNKAAGLYDKSDFIYDKTTDTYRCPADQVLTKRYRSVEAGKEIDRYYASSLIRGECPLKASCTNGKERRVSRWEHEHVLVELDKRMAAAR